MSTVKTQTTIGKAPEVFYPSSDGEPMAETPSTFVPWFCSWRPWMTSWRPKRPPTSGRTCSGTGRKATTRPARAPDLMVIKGVGREERRCFFSLARARAVPCLIIEIVAERTGVKTCTRKPSCTLRSECRNTFSSIQKLCTYGPPCKATVATSRAFMCPWSPTRRNAWRARSWVFTSGRKGPCCGCSTRRPGKPCSRETSARSAGRALAQQDERLARQDERLAQAGRTRCSAASLAGTGEGKTAQKLVMKMAFS